MAAHPPFFTPEDYATLAPTVLEPGVLLTPLLTENACARLLDAADARGEEPGFRPPNSMHETGTTLASIGLEHAVDELVRGPLGALVPEHFAAVGGDTLDHHHSYFVDYGGDGDQELGFHVDDSEVTLNLCLGTSFSGAELILLGRRCDLHRQSPIDPSETLEIEHEVGSCVLHFGRHRHRVDPIRRGRRRNLIAWLRSSAYRAQPATECPPWCGLYAGDAR